MFTALSLAALLGLCLFLMRRCGVPAALSPLCAVCIVLLWFSAAACLDVLKAAGWLFYALCFLAGAAALLPRAARRRGESPFGTAFIGFWVLCGFFLVLFAWKQPPFTNWDEFSFWGTADKIIKITDRLYTVAEVGWPWPATQKPGLIALSYFFEFFGSYAEWRAIFACDVLLLACFSAALGLVENRRWSVELPCLAACFLLPFVCAVYRQASYPSYVYMSVLSDVPMGVLFGGATVCGLALIQRRRPLWPALLALAALTFVRDTAFPLALIAAALLCLDRLFAGEKYGWGRLGSGWAKAVDCVSLLAVPCAAYMAWAVYLIRVLEVDPLGDLGGTGKIGMAEMLVQGVLQLAGIGTTEKYADIMGRFLGQYRTLNMTAVGSGLRMTLLIMALLAASFLFSAERRHRVRCVLFGVFSAFGFAAFYLFTGFCYAFIFKDYVYKDLVSYERYIFPYYLGWAIAACALLAHTASEKQRLAPGVPALALYGLCGLFCWRLAPLLPPGTTFLDYNRSSLYATYETNEKASELRRLLGSTDDQIFFIGQGDNGGRWFEYSCALLPLQLNYSYGGGTILLPDDPAVDSMYDIRLTPAQLCDYLKEQNCRYIFAEKVDDRFIAEFGSLFTDNLALCGESGSALYEIRQTPEGGLVFEPVTAVTAGEAS